MNADKKIINKIKPAVKAFDRIDVINMIYNEQLSEGQQDQESGIIRLCKGLSEAYLDPKTNEYLFIFRYDEFICSKRFMDNKKGERIILYYMNFKKISQKEYKRARGR